MLIETFEKEYTICKIEKIADAPLHEKFCFLAKTDEEYSVICPTKAVPKKTLERTDGWKIFRLEGKLDFSLVGILAEIGKILSEDGIAFLAQSTYNTDYILVKWNTMTEQ